MSTNETCAIKQLISLSVQFEAYCAVVLVQSSLESTIHLYALHSLTWAYAVTYRGMQRVDRRGTSFVVHLLLYYVRTSVLRGIVMYSSILSYARACTVEKYGQSEDEE